MEDAELLEQFVRSGADDAFRELVQRHINFVYRAAVRRVAGDEHT